MTTQLIELDTFKKRTLKRFAHMPVRGQIFPISKTDLVYVMRCPLCFSSSRHIIAEVHMGNMTSFFTTVVCNRCLFVYRSISPGFAWFAKCWRKIKNSKIEVFNPETEKLRQKRYKKYLNILKCYADSGSVLDVGAAYGTGSKVFRDAGYSVDALEPEDNKAQYIEKAIGIKVRRSGIESYPDNVKKRYDIIIFAHCLEHLDNPALALKKLYGLLKPNGILYVEVPVLENFVTWSDALYMAHKSNFSEEHLLYLVAKRGFAVCKKISIRHSKAEPLDMGFVLQKKAKHTEVKYLKRKKSLSLNKIFNLYRRGLRFLDTPKGPHKLVYLVPHIELFYCTLQLNDYDLVPYEDSPCFMRFTPKA